MAQNYRSEQNRFNERNYRNQDDDYGYQSRQQNQDRGGRYESDYGRDDNRLYSGGYGQQNEQGRDRTGNYGNDQFEQGRYGSGYGDGNFDDRNDYDAGMGSYRGSQSSGSGQGGRYGRSDSQDYGNNRNGRSTYNRSGGYSSGYGSSARYNQDDDRGFFDKAGDEVASWFGDDDAERRRRQDHRGRGPSDYTRSDDRIREDVNDRLTDDWQVDASDISVSVDDGEVTLNGHVDSRTAKRHAEDCVHDVSGVGHVQNNLRVRDRNDRDDRDDDDVKTYPGDSNATNKSVTEKKAKT